MSRVLSSLCVALSTLAGCDEPKAAPAPPPPTPRSTLIVEDKPVETPTKLAIGTDGESSVRIVLSSAPLSCGALRKSFPERPPKNSALTLDFWLVRPLEENGGFGPWSFRSAYLEDEDAGRGLAAHGALLDALRETKQAVHVKGLELALGDGRRELGWTGDLEAKSCGRVKRAEEDRPQKELTFTVADTAIAVGGMSLRPEGQRYVLRLSRAPHDCNTVFTEGYDMYLDVVLDGDPPKVALLSLNGDSFPETPSRSSGLEALKIELEDPIDSTTGHAKGKVQGVVDLRGYKTELVGTFEALRCTLLGAPKPAPSASSGR